MMTTRRSFLAVGGAAAVAATLAACSSQSGKGSGSAAGGITLWTHNGGNKEELDVVNSAVKDFNAANPNTPVTVKSFPQESYNDAIASAAVSGNLPDILDLDGPIMPNWAWAGYLSPLTISQDLQDKVIDSAKGVWNDKLYSVGPYDTSLCFLGRKSAFDQAGVAVPTIDKPWTKGEFMDALDKLSKLNPRVEFAQTYPDEIQGAFESSADALQAALYASREQGFWVGIGVGELRIPRFAGALGTVSTNDCTGDALEFSRLAVEAARTGAPARGIAVSAHDRAVADMASGLTRLLYRVCSDRTEAEWRVVDLLVPGVRGQQRAVAQALGITTQAVSRTLMRSLWHEEQAARPAVLDLLNRLDSASPTK